MTEGFAADLLIVLGMVAFVFVGPRARDRDEDGEPMTGTHAGYQEDDEE